MQNSCNRLWVCILRVRVLTMFACSCACCELKRRVSTLGDRCVIVLDWWCVLCCIIALLSSTHTSGPRDPRVTQCVHLLGNVLLWSLIPNRHRVRTYDLGSRVSGFPCPLWYFYVDFGDSLSGSERCLHCKSLLPHVRIYWSGWALSNWDRVAKPVTI